MLNIEKNEDKLISPNNTSKISQNEEELEGTEKEESKNFSFNKDSYFKLCKLSGDNLYFSEDNLDKIVFYEQSCFNAIEIEGDGNCLYRAVSFHYSGHENNYNNIRILTYNYVKQNHTFVYEYCYEEKRNY